MIFNMHVLALYLVIRQLTKNDAVIGVSGDKGCGKSTFTIKLFMYIFRHREELVKEAIMFIEHIRKKKHKRIPYDIPYEFMHEVMDFEKNIAYRRSEVDAKAYALPKGSHISIDEGSRGFYKRNWNTKEQKDLVQKFWQIRHRRLLITVNIQDFFTLDSDLRGMLNVWVFIPQKGTALLFIKDRNPFITTSGDRWHITLNSKVVRKGYRGPKEGIGKLIKRLRKTINYRGEMSFQPMAPTIESKFLKISEAMKETSDVKEEEPKAETKLKKQQIAIIQHLRNEEKWKINKIAQITGLNPAKVSNIANGVYGKTILQPKPIIVTTIPSKQDKYSNSNLALDSTETQEEAK